jgi:tripartite-type tricarboxylate transporter receptor subunit TctC
MLQTPDVRDKLAAQGVESASSTPAQVTVFMRAEVAKWAKFIRDTGLKLD